MGIDRQRERERKRTVLISLNLKEKGWRAPSFDRRCLKRKMPFVIIDPDDCRIPGFICFCVFKPLQRLTVQHRGGIEKRERVQGSCGIDPLDTLLCSGKGKWTSLDCRIVFILLYMLVIFASSFSWNNP